jgi:allantoicase
MTDATGAAGETSDDWRECIDLAAEKLGGVALLANDEFFAEKDNLLRAHAAVWKEHEYTDRGKWMDGWETRRRREPGYDWCIVRLGLPGVIRGVVVDTAFFRGNFPAECSLDACALSGHANDLQAVAEPKAVWTEILPRTALRGDAKNELEITGAGAGERFTHVRLNIFPDGGVARLRVHGEVRPDWERLARHGSLVDVAALSNGGYSVACSDMFFGARQNLLAPGRPFNMADGWETRRRRGPGHDWNLIRLGAPGTIRRLEVDTTHFRGNAPGRVMVEASSGAGEAASWRVLLPETGTQPHTVHVFDDELRVLGPVSFVRLNVFPDGGVARLRAFAELLRPGAAFADVTRLERLSPDEARTALLACCGSSRWAAWMASRRPFEDVAALLRQADRAWWGLEEGDWLEAFAAHPRIGGAARAGSWSSSEQSGVAGAAGAVLERLAAANVAYAERFGFSFIVCATGKSAEEMLALLEQRLAHTRADELRTAAEEQAKITRLRLVKLTEGR